MWRSAWSRPTPNKSASAGGLPLPSRASLNTPGFAATRARGLPFGAVVSGLPPFGCSRGATGVQQRGNRGAAESSRVQQRATGYGKMQQGASAGRLCNKVRPPSGRSPQRAALRGAGGRPKPLPTAAVGKGFGRGAFSARRGSGSRRARRVRAAARGSFSGDCPATGCSRASP